MLLLTACSGEPGPPSGDSAEPTDSAAPADTADSGGVVDCGEIADDLEGWYGLFDVTRVHTVELSVDDAAMETLLAEPETWAAAEVTVDGRLLGPVGLHLRGDPLEQHWEGKPSFRFDFRVFGECDAFAGIDGMWLDAGQDDDAQARQVVAWQVLAALGTEVPRSVYANVRVNEELFGLYALVEPVDARFLARRGLAPGTLWRGEDGADFTEAGLVYWDDVDADADPTAFDAVVKVAQASEAFYDDLAAVVDVEQFVTMWAALATVRHAGSYPYRTGDVYLYRPDDRFRFIPWKVDDGWDGDFVEDRVEGVLGVRCVYDVPCDAAWRARVQEMTAAGVDVPATVQEAFDVSAESVADDPRRRATVDEVAAAREELLERASSR